MGVPFQVTFQELWPTDEVMSLVGERLERVQTTHGGVDRCLVVIDRPRHRRGKGRRFRVAVTVTLGDLSSAAQVEASSEHARLAAALSRAFQVIDDRLGSLTGANRGGVRRAAA